MNRSKGSAVLTRSPLPTAGLDVDSCSEVKRGKF